MSFLTQEEPNSIAVLVDDLGNHRTHYFGVGGMGGHSETI